MKLNTVKSCHTPAMPNPTTDRDQGRSRRKWSGSRFHMAEGNRAHSKGGNTLT